MKRSGFLKTLAAFIVAPKLIYSKSNTYDGKVKYMPYKDFLKVYPLTPEECFNFTEVTKESYDGAKLNICIADEAGNAIPKDIVDWYKKTGMVLYRK